MVGMKDMLTSEKMYLEEVIKKSKAAVEESWYTRRYIRKQVKDIS